MCSLGVPPAAFLSEMRAEVSWGCGLWGPSLRTGSASGIPQGPGVDVPDTSEVALNVTQVGGCSLVSRWPSLRPVFFVVLPLEKEILVAVW